MKNIETIREDLSKIKYYNSKKEWFDKIGRIIGNNEAAELAERYGKVICKAHPRIYEYYASVYVLNNTQEITAEDLDYSMTYIKKIGNALLEYLQENID